MFWRFCCSSLFQDCDGWWWKGPSKGGETKATYCICIYIYTYIIWCFGNFDMFWLQPAPGQLQLAVRKAITKPPTKRSRSEGPVSRTRREEAVFREELKKDEAQSCQRSGQRAVVRDRLVHALNCLSYVMFGSSENDKNFVDMSGSISYYDI